jgi:hypothetical protein
MIFDSPVANVAFDHFPAPRRWIWSSVGARRVSAVTLTQRSPARTSAAAHGVTTTRGRIGTRTVT